MIAKNKKLFIILGVLILAGVLLLLSKNAPSFIPGHTPKPENAGARIFFAPSLVSFKGLGQKSVDLVVDTGGNAVGQVTIRLSYNPNLVTNVVVTPTDFSKAGYAVLYKKTQGAIDRQTGDIYIAYAVVSNKNAKSNTITPRAVKIATVSFTLSRQPSASQTLFTFLPLTAVYGPAYFSFSTNRTPGTNNIPAPKSLLKVVEPLRNNQ